MGRRGRPQLYDWDKLLEGERAKSPKGETAQHGVAFRCSPQVFRQQVLNEAGRRGLTVETTLRRDANGCYWIRIRHVGDPAKKETPRGRDWDAIFKRRKPTTLRRGEHFDCAIKSMRVTAYQAAKRRGVTIKTTSDERSVTIYPQPKEES